MQHLPDLRAPEPGRSGIRGTSACFQQGSNVIDAPIETGLRRGSRCEHGNVHRNFIANALSRLAGHVNAHSKIALNIHRDPNGFFEWHRIAKLGLGTGAVVVSEPCDPHPIFKPGIHYLEESGRHLLNLIEWLLNTPDGAAHAAKIQQNGQALLHDAALAAANAQALAAFIQTHRPDAP